MKGCFGKIYLLAGCLGLSSLLNNFPGGLERQVLGAPVAQGKSAKAQGVQRHYANPDRSLQSYLSALRAKLLRVWEPTDGKNIVILEAVVTPQGGVSDIKANRSKANDVAIQSATMALEQVQPLEPLPNTVRGNSKLTLTFSSQVDPHGDSTTNINTEIAPITENMPGISSPGSSAPAAKP
jgi:hypothetical protein